jgi:FKBP-type peptidyl-prolyl cis-trans isomerase SlyD
MLPKFEDHLSTLNTGDAFEFTLASADAYGEMDQDAIIDLEKSIFMIDGKTDDELLTIGNVIPMRDDQGHMLQGTVVSVSDDSVRMDFNHPMAGNTLHFTGKVIDVREASAEELSHGHVHGAGGHHH